MNGDAVKAIASLEDEAQARTISVGEEVFTTRKLHRLPLPEKHGGVPALKVSSLESVVNYVDAIDGPSGHSEIPGWYFLHVSDPENVEIVGSLFGVREGVPQRHVYLRASCEVDPFSWGVYLPTDELLVRLQARFAPTDDSARLAAILGNLIHEETIQVEDDGVTQRAKARRGIALAQEVSVRNPFELAPFRSFAEVEPVPAPFVLRLRKDKESFRAALFEADGGRWRRHQVERIKGYLRDELDELDLPEVPPVIG